jgi:ATP-binding cassette, subfamily B (MDR/TAP), member 9
VNLFQLTGARVNTRLRIQLVDSLLSQEIGFFDQTKTGELSSRLNTSTWEAGSAVTSFINVFVKSILMLFGYLVVMTTISWQLTILAAVTLPAVAIASKWYGRYLYSISVLEEQALADGSAVCEAALGSMPTCRTLGSEHVELAEFERCMQKFMGYNTKGAWALLGYCTCVDALPELVVALVLFYGGLLVRSSGPGHITAGDLFGFVLYLSAMTEKFTELGEMYSDLVRALGATDRVFELLKRDSKLSKLSFTDEQRLGDALQTSKHFLSVNATKVLRNRIAGLHPPTCSGDIAFEQVQFRYPARPERVVLDELSLVIPTGSIVALVGSSGSGKSSIVKLIQHLYEADSGRVTIDGTLVNELSPDWISRHVAVVQQEPVLFAQSIRRNIIYGLEGTDMEPTTADIERAARLSNAASFIEGLPQGYETEVGERGIQLSGGQKQR